MVINFFRGYLQLKKLITVNPSMRIQSFILRADLLQKKLIVKRLVLAFQKTLDGRILKFLMIN